FNVVVLETKESAVERAKLVQSVRAFPNVELRVKSFDIGVLADLPRHPYYPKEVYARFWVADCFPDRVHRVLYLDGDMVVTGSIEPLLDQPLGDNILGAV